MTTRIRSSFNAHDQKIFDIAYESLPGSSGVTREDFFGAVIEYAVEKKFKLEDETSTSGSLGASYGGRTSLKVLTTKVKDSVFTKITTYRNGTNVSFYARGAFRTYVQEYLQKSYAVYVDIPEYVAPTTPRLQLPTPTATPTVPSADVSSAIAPLDSPQKYDLYEWQGPAKDVQSPKTYRNVTLVRFGTEVVAFDSDNNRVTSVNEANSDIGFSGITVSGTTETNSRVRWLARTASN